MDIFGHSLWPLYASENYVAAMTEEETRNGIFAISIIGVMAALTLFALVGRSLWKNFLKARVQRWQEKRRAARESARLEEGTFRWVPKIGRINCVALVGTTEPPR